MADDGNLQTARRRAASCHILWRRLASETRPAAAGCRGADSTRLRARLRARRAARAARQNVVVFSGSGLGRNFLKHDRGPSHAFPPAPGAQGRAPPGRTTLGWRCLRFVSHANGWSRTRRLDKANLWGLSLVSLFASAAHGRANAAQLMGNERQSHCACAVPLLRALRAWPGEPN